MKITTWNVNGIRAAFGKNAFEWVGEFKPDILCLQEIKAKIDQVDVEVFTNLGYQTILNPAERPGYSGTATFFTKTPEEIKMGLGVERFDNEGRVIQFSYPEFELFNIYFPNGGEENKRVPFKLDFYEQLLVNCENLMSEGKEIIITGDFNTAHKEIDLKNPKANEKNTGFLPEERVWIDHFLSKGFIDIFRHLYPEKVVYTWWTYRFNARKNDVGWRLDYFLVTQGIVEKTRDVIIHSDVMGSDHCPVTLELKL
ncbi:MAG: exodeoxyribonuclease III [Chloroflexi bacterium]|nr:exodeoxyribonuclease III [Chloroflexota bacterium]